MPKKKKGFCGRRLHRNFGIAWAILNGNNGLVYGSINETHKKREKVADFLRFLREKRKNGELCGRNLQPQLNCLKW